MTIFCLSNEQENCCIVMNSLRLIFIPDPYPSSYRYVNTSLHDLLKSIVFLTISCHHVQGENIWEECNRTFDRLPLSAVIDHEIFCIHGGEQKAHDTTQFNPLLVNVMHVRLYLISLYLSLPSLHQASHGQSQSMRQRLKPSCLSLL